MIKLTPQQVKLFDTWLQEQGDMLAIKVENNRRRLYHTEPKDKTIHEDILKYSSMISSIAIVKLLLESKHNV